MSGSPMLLVPIVMADAIQIRVDSVLLKQQLHHGLMPAHYRP